MQTYPSLYYALVPLAVIVLTTVILLRRKRRPPTLTAKSADSGIGLKSKLAAVFTRSVINDEFWSELETTFIEADIGIDVTSKLIECARTGRTTDDVKRTVSERMVEIFTQKTQTSTDSPVVILILGVNGVGKTTTIAKLARQYQQNGKKVLLVAADTYRAAAVEQIKEWGRRLGIEVIAQASGADAAAVAFDGVSKAVAKKFDVVLIDTAGRLHTKQNLMDELKKVVRVIAKACPGAPHERWLVLDATVGSNGLAQAREFHNAADLTGAIVTKLDGTAKGGVIFAIASELHIPITHIGTGEGMEDLKEFNPFDFVKAILN